MSRTVLNFRWALVLAMLAVLLVGITITAQEAITPGTTIEGTYTGDDIVYTLDASVGQLLLISLISEDYNAEARVDQDGVELAADADSGPDRHALLAYVVQADGSYEIVAGSTFFNSDEGAFTLRLEVIDPLFVDPDTPVTLEPDAEGSLHLYAIFKGLAGDVIDVSAGTTGEEEDVVVALVNIESEVLESDDDDGPDDDALIRRVVLPDDGIYLIDIRNARRDEPLLESVELTVNSTEQLFLTAEPQEMILGDGVGQVGTEVFTVDVEVGVTYTFIVTIESFPDEEAGIEIELLDTEFFFDPDLDTMHMTAVAWSWLSNTTGQIRLDIHPNFFGRDISSINYTIAMEVDG